MTTNNPNPTRSPWSQGFPPEPDLIARKRDAELWRFAIRIKAEAMARQAGARK